MTILISDFREAQQAQCGDAPLTARKLIYADDTLLIDSNRGQVQQYMDVINKREANTDEHSIDGSWNS